MYALLIFIAASGCRHSSGGSGLGAPPTGGGPGPSGAGSGASAPAPAPVPAPAPAATPSDDPDDWVVDTTRDYDPVVSPPIWVAPSAALPAAARCDASNNNCAIAFHDGRLFLAWRTNETHFASANARLLVVSSTDLGRTFEMEHEVAIGADVREPSLLSLGGRLILHYFEAGTNPVAFEPKHVWQSERLGPGRFSRAVTVLQAGEVPWDLKVRGGRAWMTSYRGGHYNLSGPADVDVLFQVSADGLAWAPVPGTGPGGRVYRGGVSEVGFEFDPAGGLVAVTRLEDGDTTGFGAHVATAAAGSLGSWSFPARADRERYDSPRLFRHGDDLYLVARRDVGGPYDRGLTYLPFDLQRIYNLGAYSLRLKRTTLYRVEPATRRVIPLVDLPGCGDTAFPAVARLSANEFLVANYTSPLGGYDPSWIEGQIAAAGTQIYLTTITFVPR